MFREARMLSRSQTLWFGHLVVYCFIQVTSVSLFPQQMYLPALQSLQLTDMVTPRDPAILQKLLSHHGEWLWPTTLFHGPVLRYSLAESKWMCLQNSWIGCPSTQKNFWVLYAYYSEYQLCILTSIVGVIKYSAGGPVSCHSIWISTKH